MCGCLDMDEVPNYAKFALLFVLVYAIIYVGHFVAYTMANAYDGLDYSRMVCFDRGIINNVIGASGLR